MNNPTMVVLLVSIILLATVLNLKEMSNSKKDKKISFECGFNQISMKKMTFSTNFMLIAMMFLIFDMEMTFLMPTIMSNKNKMFLMSMAKLFLILLTIILMKEWKQGSLEWNK